MLNHKETFSGCIKQAYRHKHINNISFTTHMKACVIMVNIVERVSFGYLETRSRLYSKLISQDLMLPSHMAFIFQTYFLSLADTSGVVINPRMTLFFNDNELCN